MKALAKIILSGIVLLAPNTLYSQQKETYDITSYLPPKGWKKETSNFAVSYVTANNQTGEWCRLAVYKSMASTGTPASDFDHEWNALVTKVYEGTTKPVPESITEDGWTITSGVSNFTWQGKPAMVLINTITGYGTEVTITVTMNSQSYMNWVEEFFNSIDVQKPAVPVNKSANESIALSPAQQPKQPAAAVSKFAFTTTNFDDGWVSTEREDWVEVTKNTVKVLIHYPNPVTNQYISNPDEEKRLAWNTLVAPRYSNLQNYFVAKCALSFIQGSFISGTLTDNQTGKTVYVALFKRDKSPWIEFIAPNITTFGQVTGFNMAALNGEVSNSEWDPLQRFEGYNKFAVAPSDLTGTWTNNFGGFTQYVNAYTGADAGMSTHSSEQTFEFSPNGTYTWLINVASGFVGNIKFSNSKSSGTFTSPNNWQIHFSDLEGKPKLYNAYFTSIKGARVLWLQDTGYGGYTGFGKKE
jgi:hypothetical protein